MLVQPATVARWQREGFRGCWSRARRPGRPRIDSELRSLIGRMATENCLWGAPRIHGELLKLGFTVSERTVSRYLRDRPTRRSQTWRTFLANHVGNLACASTVTPAFAMNTDDVEGSVPCRAHAALTRPPVRFHSVGIDRFAVAAPIPVSSIVYCTDSASRLHTHTFQLWQGSPPGVGRRTCVGVYGRRFQNPATPSRLGSDQRPRRKLRRSGHIRSSTSAADRHHLHSRP